MQFFHSEVSSSAVACTKRGTPRSATVIAATWSCIVNKGTLTPPGACDKLGEQPGFQAAINFIHLIFNPSLIIKITNKV